MPTLPPVFITGIGLVTPLGADRESSWRAIRAGKSATRWLVPEQARRAADHPGMLAGAPALLTTPMPPGADLISHLARTAAGEAWNQARLDDCLPDRDRVGCVIGTSKGGLRSFAAAWERERGNQDWPGEWWEQFLPHTPALTVAREFRLSGPLLCPVAACATGLTSLIRGVDLIRENACDVVLAGSVDASLLPVVLGSFARLGVLAKSFADPASACRPFSADRDGFLIGEGAAVLVLESARSVKRRRAVPLARWAGHALGADTAGLTQQEFPPLSLIRLLQTALQSAGKSPDEIDYLNLHGTGTVSNDRTETVAVQQAFGEAAATLPCSSLKGALGHLLGAAGSVELAVTLLAMRDSLLPPTCHRHHPDPLCPLDCVPLTARPQPIRTALKLSLGFGGHLAAAVVESV